MGSEREPFETLLQSFREELEMATQRHFHPIALRVELQLHMHSLYICMPFRTSCRGVEVSVAFS